MPRPTEDPPPTPDELKLALKELFALAAQCSTHHMAFSVFYPRESASGAQVTHRGLFLQMFNAIAEANLMCIRKSAEFFKPRTPQDRSDTLHSYQYPGYSNQVWIVPRETYVEFHKRVGHLTLQQVRKRNVSWPAFELTMQALNQWVDFFRAMATSYAADAETAAYCALCEEVLRNHAAKIEHEALQSRRNAAAAAAEMAAQQEPASATPPAPEPTGPVVTGAALLIGSLLWEGEMPAVDGTKGKQRKAWREKRLDLATTKNVRVRIRYARQSDSRAMQYTMCFGGTKLGTGKVARLQGPFPLAALTERLRAETEALALAEGIRGAENEFNSASWGVVAIAINPESTQKDAIRAAWTAQFKANQRFDPAKFGKGVVDGGGILLVELPWRNAALRHVDFCLATPTAPNDPSPTPAKIASASRAGLYYTRTRKAGIKTADDAAIERCLRRR
ncbi:MAG: hypothetical protein Q8N18_18475 [Opitutaceae bacterium]|nr:hypothetical protein [Opitutaceae bacterium]